MVGCHQYDYIEIVCLFHYPIRITLKTGLVIDGTALDTGRNDAGDECIKIQQDASEKLVVLDEIQMLAIRIENPHFSQVDFQ